MLYLKRTNSESSLCDLTQVDLSDFTGAWYILSISKLDIH